MSNVFTLDSLREEIEKEFAPVTIDLPGGESVILQNLLRLPRNDRKAVFEEMNKLDALDKDGEDLDADAMDQTAEIAQAIFVLVSDNKPRGKKLVSLIKDDIALTLRIFEEWMGATQPGEAKRSES